MELPPELLDPYRPPADPREPAPPDLEQRVREAVARRRGPRVKIEARGVEPARADAPCTQRPTLAP